MTRIAELSMANVLNIFVYLCTRFVVSRLLKIPQHPPKAAHLAMTRTTLDLSSLK